MRTLLTALLGLAFFPLLTGCAGTPSVFRLTDVSQGAPKVWPAPPEKARYRYLGQLTGEENFGPENEEARSTAVKVFDWLVGLVGGGTEPIVLQRPQSGTVDAEGRIYVTDSSRQAVYVFDKPAGKLHVWDMARENTRFAIPIGIAVGAGGEILVTDAGLHGVFRLNREGKPVGEFGQDVLKRPTGLARDAQLGLIYVADTYAHDIKVFGDDGHLVKVIGRRGEADGEFNYPTHLAFAAGKLYVADTMNARVQIFDAQGKFLRALGRRGLKVGDFVRPKGITVDPSGNLYVVESYYDRLLVFNAQGDFLMPLGGTGKGIGQFYLPAGVWSDRQGRIYVADMFNGRVVIFQFLGGD
ncbi:MAG: 6-bladed beta-propeller [Sulfuricella sp.]